MSKNILIATEDMFLRSKISEILSAVPYYNLRLAINFDSALDKIIHEPIDIVLSHQKLGGLTGTDLMVVAGRIKPDLPFILFDNDISAKTAMAAFRLGARDYMPCLPKSHLLLMQIERAIGKASATRTQAAKAINDRSVDYATLLDPQKRAITLVLQRHQYQALHQQLEQLGHQINATFVGVLDSHDNIVDAIGDLATLDIRKLKKFVGIDTQSNQRLADVLGLDRFLATFWQGELFHVYMLTLIPDKSLLVAISPASMKAGMVWLQLKSARQSFVEIIDQDNHVAIQPIFT